MDAQIHERDDNLRIVWGAAPIGKAIDRIPRKTYHMLRHDLILAVRPSPRRHLLIQERPAITHRSQHPTRHYLEEDNCQFLGRSRNGAA